VSPSDLVSSHTMSVLVDNEPGILARVVGLFSGRGYNIESLTVAETDAKENLSRITIVTKGTPMIIEQIKAQLDRLVPVHKVRDLTVEGPHIERELALVKVKGTGDKRVEALRLADVFSRQGNRRQDRFLRVRGHRQFRQGADLRRPDGRLGPGRCRPHRHRRHVARRRGVVSSTRRLGPTLRDGGLRPPPRGEVPLNRRPHPEEARRAVSKDGRR